jgi:beta-N-acetylhexosaminidase
MVMVGHLLYPAIDPGRPASLSPEAVGMLREELGFEGVVVTDDLAMAAVSGGRSPARAAVGAVESGEIPRERVEASVERVLAVKARYPLWETRAR